jgi:hypothetical protein
MQDGLTGNHKDMIPRFSKHRKKLRLLQRRNTVTKRLTESHITVEKIRGGLDKFYFSGFQHVPDNFRLFLFFGHCESFSARHLQSHPSPSN